MSWVSMSWVVSVLGISLQPELKAWTSAASSERGCIMKVSPVSLVRDSCLHGTCHGRLLKGVIMLSLEGCDSGNPHRSDDSRRIGLTLRRRKGPDISC